MPRVGADRQAHWLALRLLFSLRRDADGLDIRRHETMPPPGRHMGHFNWPSISGDDAQISRVLPQPRLDGPE